MRSTALRYYPLLSHVFILYLIPCTHSQLLSWFLVLPRTPSPSTRPPPLAGHTMWAGWRVYSVYSAPCTLSLWPCIESRTPHPLGVGKIQNRMPPSRSLSQLRLMMKTFNCIDTPCKPHTPHSSHTHLIPPPTHTSFPTHTHFIAIPHTHTSLPFLTHTLHCHSQSPFTTVQLHISYNSQVVIHFSVH